MKLTAELEQKIIRKADEMGVDTHYVQKQLDFIKKRKNEIKGVWSLRNWMWIATEQSTKGTWFGVVFSPFVDSEWGSWYVGEPEKQGAVTVVKPEYRWKMSDEKMRKEREMRKLMGLS